MSTEKITARLRKLIRLGESPDENEAANALKQAAEIAAKYHLDLASIDASHDDGAQLGQRKSDVVLWGTRKRKYRWQLAHVVAQAWGCAPWTLSRLTVQLSRMPSEAEVRNAYGGYFNNPMSATWELRETSKGAELVLTRVFGNLPDGDTGWRWTDRSIVTGAKASQSLVMFGRKDAAEAAVYVYHVLLQAVDTRAKEVASGRTGVNDARWGIVFGLGARLDAMFGAPDEDEEFEEPELREPVNETGLVLAQASDDATRFLEDSYGRKAYKDAPGYSAKDPASYLAGKAAADEIEIPDPSSGRAAVGSGIALGAGEDRQLA